MIINEERVLRSATTSDDETSTDQGAPASLVGKVRSPIVIWSVFAFLLLVIWGVSLLPAIFYLNPSPADPFQLPVNTNVSNHSIPLPKPHYPCNLPLRLNIKSHVCDLPCTFLIYFTKDQDHAQFIVDNICLTISLLGLVFILITWLSLKQLRVFPHIIPLYIQGTSSCVSFLIVIGNAMGRKEAFCSDEFIGKATANPTTFCVAQALLIQYLSNVTAMWFVVYSIFLVQMILSKNTINARHSTKKQHLISAACCCLLPWILVGLVFHNGGYGTVFNMRICLPIKEDWLYYTNAMITEIAQGVGCSCLLIVVFKLFLLRNLNLMNEDHAKRRKSRMDKVVIRLLCLMFAYGACTALVYIPMCVQMRNKNLLMSYLNKYLGCLKFAPVSSACSAAEADYQSYTYPYTFIFSYTTSALFTISTIWFLAFNRQSQRLWSFWWQRFVACCCLPEENPNEA